MTGDSPVLLEYACLGQRIFAILCILFQKRLFLADGRTTSSKQFAAHGKRDLPQCRTGRACSPRTRFRSQRVPRKSSVVVTIG